MGYSNFDALNDDIIVGKPETVLPKIHTYEQGGTTRAIERIKQRHLEAVQQPDSKRHLNLVGYGFVIIACLFLAEFVLPNGIKPTDIRNQVAYRVGQPDNWLHEERTFAGDFSGLRNQLVRVKGWCGPLSFVGAGEHCNQLVDSYADSAYRAAKQYHGLK